MNTASILKKLLGLLLPVLVYSEAEGQFADSLFVRYTFRDGLSSNYITSLQQDELGYIWVGTETGLNRFDGLGFKNFSRDEQFLPTGVISRLKRLEPGKMAILSYRGIHLLNTKDLSFRQFYIPDSSLLSSYLNAAWDIQLLADRSVALTTATGFYVFGPGGDLKFRHDAFTLKDYGKRILYGRDIMPVSENELLIYIHNYGLAHYNITTRVFHEISPEEKQWDIFRVLSADEALTHSSPVMIGKHEYLFFYLLRDSIGYYDYSKQKLVKSPLPFQSRIEINWQSRPVAVNDSLFVVNGANGGFYSFILNRSTGKIRFQPGKHLAGYTIEILFVDREKRVWAGTRNGLLRQRINDNFLEAKYYAPAPDDQAIIGFKKFPAVQG